MTTHYRQYIRLLRAKHNPSALRKLGLSYQDIERMLAMMRSGATYNDAHYTVKQYPI